MVSLSASPEGPTSSHRTTSTTSIALRYLALGLPLAAITAPVYWLLSRQPETPVEPAKWVLVVLSALANVVVIAYHYTIPAHPKFLMLPWRRLVLRVHIISGTVELIAGLLACFSGSPAAALIMAVAGLFFHVPSAFFQIRIVFGSKAIMAPAYLLCIVTHAFCAGMLLAQPESRMWAVNTFLVFNVYVWCRVYYYLFDLLKLFSSEKYTISILAAGTTMIPALFGSLGFMLLAAFIGLYVLLYRALFVRSEAEYLDFVRERARDSAMRPDLAQAGATALETGADEHVAQACFRLLDHDGDGVLDADELRLALAPWGLPAAALDTFAQRLLAEGPVDFSRFLERIWTIGAIQRHGARLVATDQAKSDRDKAELVFRHLDIDNDGCLSSLELDFLLLEWGLPAAETRRYLARLSRDARGIRFDEFFRQMGPVWRYIYYDVFRAQDLRRRGEMIGRSLSAIRDERKTDALRQKVKQDLLARVPFLANAGDELIADLAASLVAERHPAGHSVFHEGEIGRKFYLVGAGLVRVSRRGETLADLGPGACVGEGALLTDEPRAATITAVNDVMLFSLTRASFDYLTEKYPHIREQLRELHKRRRVETNLLALKRRLIGQVPFLRGADNALLDDLATAMNAQHAPGGAVIVREDEPGDRFYLIEDGQAQVLRRGRPVALLGPGSCFGEGALLTDTPRAATVVADGDVRLFTLDRAAFERITTAYPHIHDALLRLHHSRTPFADTSKRDDDDAASAATNP